MAGEIAVGARIVTSDGQEIGKVKKVEESAFQVDAPMAFDYWLENSIVKATGESGIELSIAESELGGYKMDRPHDHNEFQGGIPSDLNPATMQGDVLRRGARPRM